jgi:hypothetical protein
MGDGETFPEQAERGSIHGNGGIREQTFVVNISLLGFTAVSLSRLRLRVLRFHASLRRTLNFARSEAVKRRAPVEFVASVSGDVWQYVVSVDGEELRIRRGRDSRLSLTDGNVVFNALGRRQSCSPSDCTFIVASTFSGVEDRSAAVSVMGRVGRADDIVSDGEDE